MYQIAVTVVVLATLAGGAAAAWLLVRYDRHTPAFAFGVLFLANTLWNGAHLGTLVAETLQWQLLFTQLSHVGMFAPVAWLVFAFRFTDRGDLLSRRRVAALAAVPAATLPLILTTQFHGLHYTSMGLASVAGHPMLQITPGPWYYVNFVYAYALLLSGTGLLLASVLSDNRLYRWQSAVLVTCISAPWVANLSYVVGVRPIPWVDPTPVVFVAASIPLAVFVVRTDLATFLPVAYERVFRTLDDPMVVVTPDERVIDANAAARAVLADGASIQGEPVAEVVPDTLLDGERLRDDLDGAVECSIARDDTRRQYLVRRQAVDPAGAVTDRGTVLAMTDITGRKERERELEALADRLQHKNEQLERLADVVSHDMRTPVSTAESLTTLLRRDVENPDPAVEQSLRDLAEVHEQLGQFVDHLPRLARESTEVEAPVECDLETVARRAWGVVDTHAIELEVVETTTLRADPRRLQQAFENLFRNAVEHGSTSPASHAQQDAAGTSSGEPSVADAPEDAVEHSSTSPGSNTRENAVEHGSTSPASHAQQDAVEHGGTTREEGDRTPPEAPAEEHAREGFAPVGSREDVGGVGSGEGPGEGGAAGSDPGTASAAVTVVSVGTMGSVASDVSESPGPAGFYVADDGPGIPAELSETLFEFGTSTGNGTGFGLAIVRTIVEAHGWSISVTDSEHGGARFEVSTVE